MSQHSNLFVTKEYNPFKQADYSDWVCHLFGSSGEGISYRPLKGNVPNFFNRFCQKLILGHNWVKYNG